MESREKFQWTNTSNQYYGTFVANLLLFGHGMILGWVSPAIPKLMSENITPLQSGPLTNEQVSWIGSINCIGALFGSFCCSYFPTVFGTKRATIFLAIPTIAFWMLISFGNLYYHILIARFICGAAGGTMQTIIVLYVAEIANNDIRGSLASISLFMRNVGTLIGYILGATVEYEYIPYICVLIPIAFAIIFSTLPNTPMHYAQRGDMKRAEDALKYYKGYKGTSSIEDDEFYKEFEKLKMTVVERQSAEKLRFSDFCNRPAMRGLCIGTALSIFTQFTCTFTLVSYAVITFAKTGASIDPHLASIFLAFCLIFGSLTTTYLADRLGRRVLNIISLSFSALGLFTTAFYHYLYLNGYDLSLFGWVPIVSLSFVIFISSAGILPLTNICSIENLPTKIRTEGMAIICFVISLSAFASVKLYPILLETLDLHGTFMIYGTGCVVGTIFIIFVLGDTSGTSLDDVGVKVDSKHKNKTDNV